jgi:phosphatidylserine/phosphatidylglycerophosphate/cardiolipin synthase-like enzyme
MSKVQIVLFAIIIAVIAAAVFLVVPILAPEEIIPQKSAPPALACSAACSLIVEPDDGMMPVLKLIQNASSSIDFVMYELSDKEIETALARAEARGVIVRVILSTGYQGEPSVVNEPAFEALSHAHVAVKWAPAYFDLTHEKSIVVDGAHALVMSFNLVPKFYPTARDFGIFDDDKNDVSAMEATFNADWQGNGIAADSGDNLVWSPGSRGAMLDIISTATKSLYIYNEEMADNGVIAALVAAAVRGVVVDVLMTYSPDWKIAFKALGDAGVNVRTYSSHAARYIHAKMIIADGRHAFIGSENFSATSLDYNRELGILVRNTGVIQKLVDVFTNDWQAATIFKK